MSIATTPVNEITADKGPILLATTVAVYSLAVIAVGLRFLSRRLSRAGFWWDDWLALLALMISSSTVILGILVTQYGMGKHATIVGTGGVHNIFKVLYILEITYAITMCLVKYSILCFYWRIFKVTQYRIPFYIMFGVVTAWFIAAELGAILKCVPASSLWNPKVHGHCFDIKKFLIGTAVLNILTDIVLLLMPLPFVWSLQISRTQKLAVTTVFLIGAFVTVVSVIRLVIWLQLKRIDPTWNYFPGVLWNIIEPNIGIVSACLPTMRPILRFLLTGSLQGTTSGKSSRASSGNEERERRSLGKRFGSDRSGGSGSGKGTFSGWKSTSASPPTSGKSGVSKWGSSIYIYTRNLRKESERDLNMEERGVAMGDGNLVLPGAARRDGVVG